MATPCPKRAPLLLIPDVDELRRRLLDLARVLAALAATGPHDPPDAVDDDPYPWERTAPPPPTEVDERRRRAEAVTHLAAAVAAAQSGPVAPPVATGGGVLVPLRRVLLDHGHLDALAGATVKLAQALLRGGPGPVGAVQQWGSSHGQRGPTVAGAWWIESSQLSRALPIGGADVEDLAARLAGPGPVELGDDDLDRYHRVTAQRDADWHPIDPPGVEHRRARLWRRPLPGPRRRPDLFQPSRQAIRRRRRQIRPGRPM